MFDGCATVVYQTLKVGKRMFKGMVRIHIFGWLLSQRGYVCICTEVLEELVHPQSPFYCIADILLASLTQLPTELPTQQFAVCSHRPERLLQVMRGRVYKLLQVRIRASECKV